MNDLKVVLRRLIKHPRFAAVAVLLLVFGAATFGNSCAACAAQTLISRSTFDGLKAGDEIVVSVVRLCWCPPGKFIMGSPRNEPEWRPDEDQVEVTLTKGFWMGKFEATQGQWKQVMGKLPGPLTTQLPEGDDFPVGNVNFAEAEAFCQRLTEIGHQSGELPNDWQFRLPTEAQWEYACRAGTTTATAFGDKLNSKQANFKGQPYNGEVANVITHLQDLKPRLSAAAAEATDKTIEYYQNNLKRMKYEDARRRHEPVGSGAIESTCRQLQCRMKRCGQFWSTAGDEALLSLEMFWRNDRWELLFPHAKITALSNN